MTGFNLASWCVGCTIDFDRTAAAGLRQPGPRDRSSALELRLYERPGAKRVRPARMVLWRR
jgi:hypothetical protein